MIKPTYQPDQIRNFGDEEFNIAVQNFHDYSVNSYKHKHYQGFVESMAETAVLCLEKMNKPTSKFTIPKDYQQLRAAVRPVYEEYMALHSIPHVFAMTQILLEREQRQQQQH
ncbi:hypothetical protein CYY_004476 [Polysphondylium violaceum]|uniref:Uncharacterized protein n=1 Tax=Polysphondylium violaceum TaxID=133409 RepID=A0A8J4PV92_9MYCE|nr:hypothetical protein CYY_004476 [Polysphondylium violaceum]